MRNEVKKKIQENAYSFPYHYIPDTSNGFSQSKCLSWGYEYMSYLNFVINKIKEIKFNSMLDIGCGDGRLIFELNKEFDSNKISGVDSSEKALSFAKVFNPKNKFWENIDQIKLHYDLVVLVEVIEHIRIDQVSNFIFKITNLLEKDGYLILTVPSDKESVKKKHYQNFNKHMLKNILDANYEIKEVNYINVIRSNFKARLLKSILANKYFILNNARFLRLLYNYYCNNLLVTSEDKARRICLVARKIKS